LALKALGRGGLPTTVELEGGGYTLVRSLQHSFFAATGRYEGQAGRIVVKWGRTATFLGIPLSWLGRWLTAREARIYRTVQDLSGVPTLLGTVGVHGLAHRFVDGRPYAHWERMAPEFFDELERLVREIHARGVACVDLSRPANILVGVDGSPYIFDFQIAVAWPAKPEQRQGIQRWIPHRIGTWALRHLQHGDVLSILTHRSRSARDSLTPESLATLRRRTWPIQLHAALTLPYRWCRHGFRLTRSARRKQANSVG